MKKREKYTFAVSRLLVIPFLVVLTVLTAVSFCIPLRPDRSMSERRLLKEFPEFSMETLLPGEYFSGIDLWFSDTFPGREGWLDVAAYTRSLHGKSDIAAAGDMPAELAVVPTATKPAITDEPIEQITVPVETESAPTESEHWGGVDAGENAQVMFTRNVVQVGDTVFNALGFSQYYSDRYARAISSFTARAAELGVTVVHALHDCHSVE